MSPQEQKVDVLVTFRLDIQSQRGCRLLRRMMNERLPRKLKDLFFHGTFTTVGQNCCTS